jgi:hypothetical protein
MAVAEIMSVVVEDVRPTQKMGGWDPVPVEPTVGELGLCGPTTAADHSICVDGSDCCRR